MARSRTTTSVTSEWAPYLTSLGMSKVVIGRVSECIATHQALLGTKPVDIFVSEYVNSDATRTFESLWVFTEELAGEFHDFQNEDLLDYSPYQHMLGNVNIVKQDFNGLNATSRSRLTVNIMFKMVGSTAGGLTGTFKASGDNCETLWRLTTARLIPNLNTAHGLPSATRPRTKV